jgi:hypothetical protein
MGARPRTGISYAFRIRVVELASPALRRHVRAMNACPCCAYLTLPQRGGFDLCPVCFWEDDGQDDLDASEVRGGPNGDLTKSHCGTQELPRPWGVRSIRCCPRPTASCGRDARRPCRRERICLTPLRGLAVRVLDGACLVEHLAELGGGLLDLGPPRTRGNEEGVLVGVLRIRAVADEDLALLGEAVREPLQDEEAEGVALVVGRSIEPRRTRDSARGARG